MGEETERKQKIVCLQDANSTSSTYVPWIHKRENIWETFKVSVSSVFPKCLLVCASTTHMLKTQKLRLESRKCYWNFPKTFFCLLDAILLLQQCFLVCAALKTQTNLEIENIRISVKPFKAAVMQQVSVKSCRQVERMDFKYIPMGWLWLNFSLDYSCNSYTVRREELLSSTT